MKKVGILIFGAALVVGLVLANATEYGRVSGKIFNVSLKFTAERGSGTINAEQRDAAGFSSIKVGGAFRVEVHAGGSGHSVEVEGDDNLLRHVRTEVAEGTLRIFSDRKISPTAPIVVRVSAPGIEKVEVAGAADATVDGLLNETLSIDASGASKLRLSGETSELNLEVSGASRVEASDLTAHTATVDASGASRASVNVSALLTADASGASTINHSGDAQVRKNTSGAGRVVGR